jgi:hypothetical protein
VPVRRAPSLGALVAVGLLGVSACGDDQAAASDASDPGETASQDDTLAAEGSGGDGVAREIEVARLEVGLAPGLTVTVAVSA